MSTRLERYAYPALVALALGAALVMAWPAPAQAQATPRDGARGAEASPTRMVVVHPGDSLWSISQRLLPANATAQQVYNETARIYTLNRDRIGGDPDLIHAGEVLEVSPAPEVAAEPAGSDQPSRDSGGTSALSEKAPKEAAKAALTETSRGTVPGRSLSVSRTAGRTPSDAQTQRPMPELASAPVPLPAAKLSFSETSSDHARWLPERRLLAAAAVGALIGWGAVCFIFAAGFFVGRTATAKRTTVGYSRNDGGGSRRLQAPRADPSAPGPSLSALLHPSRKSSQRLRSSQPRRETRTTKGDRFRW